MAGINTEHIVSEIEKLKAIGQCKIIKNAGDFLYLINVTIPDSDIMVKFQLTTDYPKVPPTVFIRHPTMSKDEVQKVMFSIPSDTSSIVAIFECIRDLLADQSSYSKTEAKKLSPKSVHNKKQKNGVNSNEAKSAKKPSMRTAADVIKRIQWDSSLQSDKFIVGYLDRFLGVQEQPFNAFNWVNPAEADWMDLNIPEHRIEYFKYEDKIVWEKKSRLDNIFGSTGGMTIDKCLAGEVSDGSVQEANSIPSDSAAEGSGTTLESTAVSKSSMKNEKEGDSSSDEDDIQITIGNISRPPTMSPKSANSRRSNQLSSVAPKHQQKHRQDYKSKDRPNHFIAIPVTDASVVAAVSAIQDEFVTLGESEGEQYLVEPQNLHITLCAVRVDTQDELDIVTQVLYELVLERSDEIRQEISVDQLDTFWSRVLYAKTTLNKSFHQFVLKLRNVLQEKQIRIFDSDDEFVSHLTILKFPRTCKEIHFSIDHYLRIKRESQSDDIHQSTSLEKIILYSMDRDQSSHYIEKLVLDV